MIFSDEVIVCSFFLLIFHLTGQFGVRQLYNSDVTISNLGNLYISMGGIHQSFLDEKLEMISSVDFLQFTIHNHDSGKSTLKSMTLKFWLSRVFVWQEF